MDIIIEDVHFDADEKLLDLVREKVGKFEHLFDRITKAEVYLKLEEEHHHIKDKTVEIKLNVPQTTLFVSDAAKTFELALTDACNSMRTQLTRYKDKLKDVRD
jgi:ribosomal subunit interface protein